MSRAKAAVLAFSRTRKGVGMAKRPLVVVVDCGERTCASKPGVFCEFVEMRGLQARAFCRLDGVELRDETGALSGHGSLQRTAACLASETFQGGLRRTTS